MTDSAVFHDTSDDSYRDASGPLVIGGGGAAELDYVELTSNLTISGTSGAPTTVITGNSVSYDGSTRISIEFYCSIFSSGNSAGILQIYEDSTLLGRIYQSAADDAGSATGRLFRTPSNASHSYTVKGWNNGGSNSTIFAAAASGFVPAFLRITEA